MVRSSARVNWQMRVQRKLGADYLRGQSSRKRKAAVVAAVAAVHMGLLAGFLSWRVTIVVPPMLVKVHLISAGAATHGAVHRS